MASARYLPQDLTEDILSRLPIKSLLRFRCVNKSWYSLFKSSSFITSHFQNPNNKQHGLGCGFVLIDLHEWFNKLSCNKFLRHHTFNVRLDYMLHDLGSYYSAGSCNGLVCIGTFQATRFILFNFSLKQLKIIPGFNLPHSYHVACGFGYDPKNNDYKVVRVYRRYDHVSCYKQAEVYSLRMNSWRQIGLPEVGFKPINRLHYPTYLNGAIHWLGSKNERACVICFDVSSEIFELFPLPDCLAKENLYDMSIDSYGYVLSVIKCVRSGDDTFNDIWVMREYGVHESWIQLHSIQLPRDKKELWFRGFGINKELLLQPYNGLTMLCPDNEVKNIEFDHSSCSFYVVPYVESLVSLEEYNE